MPFSSRFGSIINMVKNKFILYVKNNKKSVIKIVSIIIFLAIMVWITIQLMPIVSKLMQGAEREEYIAAIKSRGFIGWLTVFGIQILQVIVALVPGEPVEVFAGLVYGAWGGLLTCLAGVLIGSIIIFYLVKLLGYSFVASIFEGKELKKLAFLKNEKKLEWIIFILFFIPGSPKDILTYAVGFTPIKPMRFFVISTIARIPSIITSTYAGSIINDGRWLKFAIIYGITAVVTLAGVCIYKKIMKKFGSKSKDEEDLDDTDISDVEPDISSR